MGLGGGLCCSILARESVALCLSRGRGILHYGYGRSPVRLRLGHCYQGHGHSPCTTVSTGPGCGKIGPLAIPGEHRPPPGPLLLVFHTKGIQSLVAPTIGSNQAATPDESLIITYLIITISCALRACPTGFLFYSYARGLANAGTSVRLPKVASQLKPGVIDMIIPFSAASQGCTRRIGSEET